MGNTLFSGLQDCPGKFKSKFKSKIQNPNHIKSSSYLITACIREYQLDTEDRVLCGNRKARRIPSTQASHDQGNFQAETQIDVLPVYSILGTPYFRIQTSNCVCISSVRRSPSALRRTEDRGQCMQRGVGVVLTHGRVGEWEDRKIG